MKPVDVAHRYFDAWNNRDPAAIVATFAAGGTYSDTTTGGELTGRAIADYTKGLFEAFPDLSFDLVTTDPTGDGRVAAQWLMRGTNSGPMAGNPPTGGTIALPGADFIQVVGNKIRSVQGYFDQRAFAEQLGLQVILAPQSMGPVSFGTANYVQQGKLTKPGAFSLTSITVRSDEEAGEVQQRSQQVVGQMMQMPGFISFTGIAVGHRLFTITAWEDPESPRQLLRGGAHKEAVERFLGPDFTAGVMTSVWVPDRINTMWVRCTACGRMADSESGKCRCGQPLPEHPPYW